MCTICTPLCRVHMPINCVHTHIDLIGNLTQGTHLIRISLGLNALNDSNSVLSRCMCVGRREGGGGGGGGEGFRNLSTAECVVETFTLRSYKGQVRKAYSYKYYNDILFV